MSACARRAVQTHPTSSTRQGAARAGSESTLLPPSESEHDNDHASDGSWSRRATLIYLVGFVVALWVLCFVLTSLGVSALLRITAS